MSELRRVRADPLALDAERLRELGGVDVAERPGRRGAEPLRDPPRDRLDVIGVERRPGVGAGGVVLYS